MWEHVEGDLEIYITQGGDGVSLRKVLEAEIRNYARAARAALPRRTPAPHSRAARAARAALLRRRSRPAEWPASTSHGPHQGACGGA